MAKKKRNRFMPITILFIFLPDFLPRTKVGGTIAAQKPIAIFKGFGMTILWNDAMSVGNVKIDNDHRYLIGMINTIEAALDCEVNIQILQVYVSQLVDYTHKHFEREESYQVEIKFPHGDSHKIEHKELLRQINCIYDNVKSHTELDAYQFTTPRLVDILKDWLMRHILQDDMKMKSYFKTL